MNKDVIINCLLSAAATALTCYMFWLAGSLEAIFWVCGMAGALTALLAVLVVLERKKEHQPTREEKIEDMLAYIDLHINTRYVTSQLTTEQKELYADLIDASEDRLSKKDPAMDPPRHIERWWRE